MSAFGQGGPDYVIEEMSMMDLPGVLEIERLSFPAAWSERMFRDELKSPLSRNFVARRASDLRVAGYINFWIFAGEVHLNNVAVHPELRGKGIGSLLLGHMVMKAKHEDARWLTLEVRPSNRAAIALYEKFGFKVKGIRPRYYTDTLEDAFIMWSEVEKNREIERGR
jgi:ribosomal-protein-alanine N-acetyltransferase